ncbi:hypothetical protein [Nonomuraea sp. NPDC050643]|uniref:hypothetical protein n=1 Tax=Nonomuraea sp. NPDC050643 TaxID=3155660 RepID=UPI003401FBFD
MASHPLITHVTVLNTLDPDTPLLDDLEPVRAVTEGARVVALGEGAHFVHEFTLARARLPRHRAAWTGPSPTPGSTMRSP